MKPEVGLFGTTVFSTTSGVSPFRSDGELSAIYLHRQLSNNRTDFVLADSGMLLDWNSAWDIIY
ncbi:MAG TPA: hypothetical protein ENN68_09555 [Methanomicrobia archaeon]|nr:hypothetical protein [Methanomicrobia archaeon]